MRGDGVVRCGYFEPYMPCPCCNSSGWIEIHLGLGKVARAACSCSRGHAISESQWASMPYSSAAQKGA